MAIVVRAGLWCLLVTLHQTPRIFERQRRPGPNALPLLESRRSVLEELLLPAIKHGRLESQFVTQIRDRYSLHQMPPQNGDLLFRRVVLPLLFHVLAPLS